MAKPEENLRAPALRHRKPPPVTETAYDLYSIGFYRGSTTRSESCTR